MLVLPGVVGFFCLAVLATCNDPLQVLLDSGPFPQESRQGSSRRAITPELSTFIEGLLKSANIPGISLGVVHASKEEPVVELDAWGRKTEEGNGDDLGPDALFDLASCSKAFLASSLGLLMDDFAQGRNVTPLPDGVTQFDWNTKVRDMLPDEWELADEWASKKANFRDVLSHVSGMPRHDYSYGPADSPHSIVEKLRHLRPAYELRQKWSYNNQMYMMGAYVISKYANTSYTSFASSRLFGPLNMTSTTFWPDDARQDSKLTQSWNKFGRRIPFWFTDDIVELLAGAGGVISSAQDMTKWLAVLLNAGVSPTSNTTILTRPLFDEMTTAHAIIKGKADTPETSIQGYGMGWWRWSYQGHEIVSHTGGIPGFSTRVAFLPSDGLGIVVLANADEKADANEAIMYRIVEDVLGLPHIDRFFDTDASGKSGPAPVQSKELNEQVPPLTLNLSEYAGTYSSQGYGAFALCAPESSSHYCLEVLADFSPFINASAPQSLYASWPRIWSSHVRMVHREAETFDLQFTALFPRGYGMNTSAFETSETGESEGRVVFNVQEKSNSRRVKGFALIIDEEAVQERERLSGSVEDYADAWFEKV